MLEQFAKNIPNLPLDIIKNVTAALDEDIGTGDITAKLIPEGQQAFARVITREDCTFCGKDWVQEVFKQINPQVKIVWHINDGEKAAANSTLFTLEGTARSLLSGERTALNFVQLLSGTATLAREYADLVKGLGLRTKILDTRKTIPGLRSAQKYAVACGGCHNHRLGLYDAFLIKENHIAAVGSIGAAVTAARIIAPNIPVEVEVETLLEFQAALDAKADIIMLDEMEPAAIKAFIKGKDINAKLEISGGLNKQQLEGMPDFLQFIDRVSLGLLTKHCQSIDLSMRFINE